MRTPTRRHSRPRRTVPIVDLLIFVGGLVAACVSGVVAYRIVGPYGDGPLDMYLYRDRDPQTGKDVFIRKARTVEGVIQYVFDAETLKFEEMRGTVDVAGKPESLGLHFNGRNLTGIDRDVDHDGRPDVRDYYNDPSGLARTGFSLTHDGVIDAWEFRDAKNQLQKIEVSTVQDGKVDRWEYYKDGQLDRVEEDRDHNGHVDHWLTYDAGILMEESDREPRK